MAAGVVQTLIEKKGNLRSIEVTAFENDELVLPHLENTLARCEAVCAEANISFAAETRCEDFVAGSVDLVENGLFAGDVKPFTHAILNPPYKKINAQSRTRKLLDSAGMEVSNLYAAFVWLAMRMLEPGGELVAITPRSFCNGPYFRRFRLALLNMLAIEHIHVFKSRKKAFGDDDVLQENVILHAVRNVCKPQHVAISLSEGPDFHNVSVRRMPYEHVVLAKDRDAFIHLILNDDDEDTMCRMERFTTPLDELGIEVSTGRVVDFRILGHVSIFESSLRQGRYRCCIRVILSMDSFAGRWNRTRNQTQSCRRSKHAI